MSKRVIAVPAPEEGVSALDDGFITDRGIGREMAVHEDLAAPVGIDVFFAGPHSPWMQPSKRLQRHPSSQRRQGLGPLDLLSRRP